MAERRSFVNPPPTSSPSRSLKPIDDNENGNNHGCLSIRLQHASLIAKEGKRHINNFAVSKGSSSRLRFTFLRSGEQSLAAIAIAAPRRYKLAYLTGCLATSNFTCWNKMRAKRVYAVVLR